MSPQSFRIAFCLALIATVTLPFSHARYAAPDLVDIPIARLIKNLETRIEAAPENADLIHHLARAHGIAYAKRMSDTDTVPQNKRYQKDGVWFGHAPPHVAFRPGLSLEPADANAKAHLVAAIKLYDRALALNPKRATIIRLGRAWCANEAGRIEEAKKDLRQVIAEAWVKEGKGRGSAMGNYVSAEAMAYLKPLLDKKKDAEELADYTRRLKILHSFPRAITPIAIPMLAGLGSKDIIDLSATVAFDLDGSGRDQHCQWLKPELAAWLVHDPQANGEISSALQLFGNRSFNLMLADGYAAMRLLDDNGDNRLSGQELTGLALWSDRNADGISDKGEVRPVQDLGITFLSCKSRAGADGLLFSKAGVGFEDGSTRPTWDLILETRSGQVAIQR
jgi:hypothetical protein